MKLETIHEMWEQDSKIDILNLTNDNSNIGKLHSKYWKILNHERMRLTALEAELRVLSTDKFWFFIQGHDEETRAKGWELPPRGKITVKDEAKQLVECDKEVVEMTLRVAAAREKVRFVEDIIKNIHQRSYTISNIIRWKIFENGG